MQSLVTYSCLATPIFYKGDKISRLSCLVFWRGSDRDDRHDNCFI